jgi:hypothetical protein
VLSGTANAGGDPTNLEILTTGTQSVNVNGGSQITAFIYSPTGPVVLDGAVTGSVTGSTTTVNTGGRVTFVSSATCP